MKKIILVSIAKEKKIKDFRLVITPSGRSRIGAIQTKDYGIIAYTDKKDFEKIGKMINWALNESDDKVIEYSSDIKIEKQFYNCNSYRKVTNDYNMIFFELIEGIYSISLLKKDGDAFVAFEDENKEAVEYVFSEKPTALELGTKVMEMFEYKERYDGLIE
ncbi:osmolarity sensor protein EnvZ [Fusobacterium polymorphum]|uniref:osmolarity sensor protein EnvZ n=1 Tax=Fusobacterium nucleatum subsp. polymorphum TaxID=76857 RepID=UPI00236591EE|nr:osmolarity sensor protein EnvZ [Fusobacterium nucleatum]WDF24099.1 osmolarity sensor protein EnvZ [Fusobacterium nucleatum]